MIVDVVPARESKSAPGLRVRSGTGRVVSRPVLLEQLGTSARVTMLSGPPGSGKTVLLRSWVGEAHLATRAAWAPVGRDERDPRRFWLLVSRALRETAPGSGLVQRLTAAPELDGWAIVERLLADLAPLPRECIELVSVLLRCQATTSPTATSSPASPCPGPPRGHVTH